MTAHPHPPNKTGDASDERSPGRSTDAFHKTTPVDMNPTNQGESGGSSLGDGPPPVADQHPDVPATDYGGGYGGLPRAADEKSRR